MNAPSDPSLMKFGVGQPVPRTEDPVLLTGRGRYTDDVNEPGQAYACIVRSNYAHGVIKGIDFEKAKSMPGVLAIYTGRDFVSYGVHKCIVPLEGLKKPARRALINHDR